MTGLALFLVLLAGIQAGAPRGAEAPVVLSLRDAVGEALRGSPSLMSARDGVERADIDEQLAASRFATRITPEFTTGSDPGGVRQQQAGLSISRRTPWGTELSARTSWMQYGDKGREVRDAGYTLTVSQPVLLAFSPLARAPLHDAKRAVASAARQMDDARQRLVVRTTEAYFSIVRQQRLADAAANALERAARLREASEARARVGLATQLDLMRAELFAAQAEAALQEQQESVERARDELKLLLGRPLDSALDVDVNALPEAPAAPPGDVAALTAAALAGRIEVREARDRVADARRAESVARWSLVPDVQLTASYTRRGLAGDTGRMFQELLGGWQVGLRTTYGLDRSTAAASAARAALSVSAAGRAAVQMEASIAAEVRDAHRAVIRSQGAIALHRTALDIAERQARLARLRYERGLADNVDLVAAEGHVLHARTALIGAQVDHALARLALLRAAGQLDPAEYTR